MFVYIQVLKKAKDYITTTEKNKLGSPLVIYAQSGIGKTSIMAMIMKMVPTWLQGKSHFKLIRFLGTTPSTHNLFDVLFSVVGQIADSYNMIIPPINYTTIKALLDFMPRFFRQVASSAKEPVVILLDSVDQMSGALNCFAMKWLPMTLPTSIKLIISTLPKQHGIYTNLRKLLPNPDSYVEVQPLPESTGKQILQMFLKKSKRKITEEQTKLFLTAFRKTPSPLFLKLLIAEARKWKSYTPIEDIELGSTVVEAINKLFENLENKFGAVLVQHALGYLTLGLSGLTEFEIEDVLSCDDVVLNAVYKYHDPPVPGIVIIPPVLWARIHHDIQDYLTERLSFGKTTLNWYHRQFIETGTERYTTGGKDALLHANLTEIFLQENGVKRSITLKLRNNLTIEDADRQVKPQPFSTENRRKVACLPYHANRAIHLLGKDMVKSKVLCNFQFLCARIAAFSVPAMLQDFSDFLEITCDNEVELLRSFVTLSKESLVQPAKFAFYLIASLNPLDEQLNLQKLVDDAKEFLLSQSKPSLIPSFSCLAQSQGMSALLTSVQSVAEIITESGNALLLKNQHTSEETDEVVYTYSVFNIDTQEVTPRNCQNILKMKAVGLVSMSDSCIYVASKSAVHVYDIKAQKSEEHAFKNIIPGWKDSDKLQVVDFVTNLDSTRGAIVFPKFIAYINLEKMVLVRKCAVERSGNTLDTCLVSMDEMIIGLGKTGSNGKTVDLQGPDVHYFACRFCFMDEESVKYVETTTPLDFGQTGFAGKGEYLYIAEAKVEESNDDTAEKTGRQNVTVMNLNAMTIEKSSELEGEIVSLAGHPEESFAVTRTTKGKVYILTKNGATEVKVNFSVMAMGILWDENIFFLGSEAGNVSIYNYESKQITGSSTASLCALTHISFVQQTCITLGSNMEMKAWSVKAILSGMNKGKTSSSETSEGEMNLSQQLNISTITIAESEEELFTSTTDGYLCIWDGKTYKLIKKIFIEMTATTMYPLKSSLVVFDKASAIVKILNPFTGDIVLPLPSSIQNVLSTAINAHKSVLYLLSGLKGKEHIDIANVEKLHHVKSITLQSGLSYESLDITLSKKERYLIISSKISEKEFEQIKISWKTGGFSTQNHRQKFHAVDLDQGNGTLIKCNRQMSNIPTLGNNIQPWDANTMLITSRR